jgi:hypothetical protein
MGLITAAVIFIVSLIIGSVGIYVGVELISDRDVSFGNAIITALLGVIVYTILGFSISYQLSGHSCYSSSGSALSTTDIPVDGEPLPESESSPGLSQPSFCTSLELSSA